jgi:hypothetical protein
MESLLPPKRSVEGSNPSSPAKTSYTRPIDILEKLMFWVIVMDHGRKTRKPGWLVERLSAEEREILQRLTSDDARNMHYR